MRRMHSVLMAAALAGAALGFAEAQKPPADRVVVYKSPT